MADYDLVMPFVVVTSKGGPYDDEAFVAGYRIGAIDAEMRHRALSVSATCRAPDEPQIDLVAMRHGYETKARSVSEDGEWITLNYEQVQR